jgi:tetratricopeptide (TPR) repeat protein
MMCKWLQILTLFVVLPASAQPRWKVDIPPDVLSWYQPNTNRDSLFDILRTAGWRDRVKVLCEISFSYHDDSIMAQSYARQAYQIAGRLNCQNSRAMTAYVMAWAACQADDQAGKIRLLKVASSSLDNTSHWTLKYRIWAELASQYLLLGNIESHFLWQHRVIDSIHHPDAVPYKIATLINLCNLAKTRGAGMNEKDYAEKALHLALSNPELTHERKTITLFQNAIERLSSWYCLHGKFKEAVATNRMVIDTLRKLDMPLHLVWYFQGKFHGRQGRAYNHWGRPANALIHHDSAIYYFVRVRDEFSEIRQNKAYPFPGEWNINLANQLEEKAGVWIKLGEYARAKQSLEQSVNIRQAENDRLGVAMCLDRLAKLNVKNGHFGRAVMLYDSALNMKRQFLNHLLAKTTKLDAVFWEGIVTESICDTYTGMAEMYQAWGRTGMISGIVRISLQMARKVSYSKGEAESLLLYGDALLANQNVREALAAFNEAGKIYRDMDNLPGQALVAKHVGNYYETNGFFNKAIDEYNEAMRIYQVFEMPADRAGLLERTAALKFRMGNPPGAKRAYFEALVVADSLGLTDLQAKCHQGLADVYVLSGDTAMAFVHYKHYSHLKDTLFNIAVSRHLAGLEADYMAGEQQQRMLLLQAENELNALRAIRFRAILFGLAGFVLVLVFVIGLYVRIFRLRALQATAEIRQKLLRSQLNPHFIYNALGSIQNHIINDEPAIAAGLLAKFSKLMRNILKSSIEENISLSDELAIVGNYLELQKVRHAGKFAYSIVTEGIPEPELVFLPSMLTQPFIENAIEHGVRHLRSGGYIRVSYKCGKREMKICIEDNGVGREKAAELRLKSDQNHRSLATSITQERIKILNRKFRPKITMEVTDLIDEKGNAVGTRVEFGVPVV